MPDVKIPLKNPPAGGPNLDWTVVTAKVDKPDLREKEKPLVDLKVTNPITYIKSWWKKIIGNDGIELIIKVKPLTAIAITIIVVTVSFGIGKWKFPFALPFLEYSSEEPPVTTQDLGIDNFMDMRETAFSGELRYDQAKDKYFLFTSNSEAINLTVPENINLSEYVGKRIYAAGSYQEMNRLLFVESASDMEVLPTKAVIIPTESPTPTAM